MSKQTSPQPATAPQRVKPKGIVEPVAIWILTAIIVTVILILIWPSLTAVLGAIIAGI